MGVIWKIVGYICFIIMFFAVLWRFIMAVIDFPFVIKDYNEDKDKAIILGYCMVWVLLLFPLIIIVMI